MNDLDNLIVIPEYLISNGNIIEEIFGEGNIDVFDPKLGESVIFVSTNDHAVRINTLILKKVKGTYREYVSIDKILSDEPGSTENYPIEFLHRQTPSGMPPHNLIIKQGCIVMLISRDRNLAGRSRRISAVFYLFKIFRTPPKMTLEKKKSIYNVLNLFAEENKCIVIVSDNEYFCKFCIKQNKYSPHEGRRQLERHIKSQTHISAAKSKLEQRSLDFSIIKDKVDPFDQDIVAFFINAGIALHKLDTPNAREFFKKYMGRT